MNDEAKPEEKTVNDEKSADIGKLESMTKEELIKMIRIHKVLKKKHEAMINEFKDSNNQLEEKLRNQKNDEQEKYSNLLIELNETKANHNKLQDEISNLQNELSINRISLINESKKSSENIGYLCNVISTTIDLFQLSLLLPDTINDDFIKVYKNSLEQKQEHYRQIIEQVEEEKTHLQQRIEDLDFFNEEMKLEVEDLRTKAANYQQTQQLLQKEIDNYRRQIEDFEEQFLALQNESQNNHMTTYNNNSQPSTTISSLKIDQDEENFDETISDCINFMLDQIDDKDAHMSRACSTSSLLLSSDISTLLHSVGITNSMDDDFTAPLTFESILRLCNLLVERCRVLQYILLQNNDLTTNSLIDNDYNPNCISFTQNNNSELCKIRIRKQEHIALDTLFERIYTGMNKTISLNEWQIIIEKLNDQNILPKIRLEFDNFKFVPEEVEEELNETRTQLNQLLKENLDQRNKIISLENRPVQNETLQQLKDHQTDLENQLVKQCEKTIELENILTQENIDKLKIDQLTQIEHSYADLKEKYYIAQKLEIQLKQLNDKYNQQKIQFKRQHDLYESLKTDYERQYNCLLERDEIIRSLKIEIERCEQSKETLIEKCRNEMNRIENEFEQCKKVLISKKQDQDESYVLILKQQEQLNESIKTKINENEILLQKTLQLELDLKQQNRIILEKTQQINDYEKQNSEFNDFKIKYKQLDKEINQMKDKIENLENEKVDLNQLIDELKNRLETNKIHSKNLIQEINEDQSPLDRNCTNLESFNEQQLHSDDNSDNHHLELEKLQQENEKLNKIIIELNEKIQKQNSDSGENVIELKEKYHKMKILLTRLKKELQDKSQNLPKQNLIDLELADYEKTIKQLKDDLMSKDKEIQDFREELSMSVNKCNCLKREIENLEQQKLQEEQRANKLKELLDVTKKELQISKNREEQQQHNDDHRQILIEKLQNQLDDNKILIADLTSEKQQTIEKMKVNHDQYERTINLLEQNLRIAKHDLDVTKIDYDTLQDDFNNYKIRAQIVLKQQQANQRERTPSATDKQNELEETIEKLKINLRDANDRIKSLVSENETFQKEQDRLIEMEAKLINESRKREQELRKQHQTDIHKIENQYLKQINEHQDVLRNLTLQHETFSITYKEQINSMEMEHDNSLKLLQDQLEAARHEIAELKSNIQLVSQSNETTNNQNLLSNSQQASIGINHNSNRVYALAWSDTDHQQKELLNLTNTSASTTDVTSNQVENIPINTSFLSNKSTQMVVNENLECPSQINDDEFKKLKIRLLDTTDLLNESELNNQHLTEQVKLLKDEIRRIERNMDRAESISNLEYLKNIILKFFILKSTSERLQLIPVLVTMLKLTTDEQAQLVRVANFSMLNDENLSNNESPNQLANNDPILTSSWGSYLNIW